MKRLPRFPKPPKLPVIDMGPKLQPPELKKTFKPEFEVPPDPEELRQQRWESWRAQANVSGTGSYLEFICWEWLTKKKKLVEGVDFVYQVPMLGGRTQFGGFVVDFWFPDKNLAWNPAGLKFHQTKTRDRAKDLLSKQLLATRGIRLIFLYEDDLLEREEYTLQQAWRGIQISHRDGI